MHADFQELLAIRDGIPVDAMVAQHALECSLANEPASTAAWARLVPVYARQGQTELAAQIESRLSNPNSLPGRTAPPAMNTPCAIDAASSRTP